MFEGRDGQLAQAAWALPIALLSGFVLSCSKEGEVYANGPPAAEVMRYFGADSAGDPTLSWDEGQAYFERFGSLSITSPTTHDSAAPVSLWYSLSLWLPQDAALTGEVSARLNGTPHPLNAFPLRSAGVPGPHRPPVRHARIDNGLGLGTLPAGTHALRLDFALWIQRTPEGASWPPRELTVSIDLELHVGAPAVLEAVSIQPEDIQVVLMKQDKTSQLGLSLAKPMSLAVAYDLELLQGDSVRWTGSWVLEPVREAMTTFELGVAGAALDGAVLRLRANPELIAGDVARYGTRYARSMELPVPQTTGSRD